MIDHLRVVANGVATTSLDQATATRVSGGDVEQLAVNRLAADEAVAIMAAHLSPEQVEVILLRVLGGFTSSEVAQLMGKRAGAVRAIQARALARLAEVLPSVGVTDTWPKAM